MSELTPPTLKFSVALNCTAMTTLGVLIIITNLYIITEVKKGQKFTRSVPKYLLAYQAIGDLLVGLVYVPAVIIDCHLNVGILRYVTGPLFFNGLFARFIIACDRYVSIVEPLRHIALMHFGRVRLILQVFLWFTVSLNALPLLWLGASAEARKMADFYFQMLICLLITLVVLILIYIYISTFKKARGFLKAKVFCNNERQMWIAQRTMIAEDLYLAKQRRLTVQFAVLAISFVTTYLPILYINFVGVILKRRQYTPNILIDLSSYLYIINALFSPIFSIYQQRTNAYPKASRNFSLQPGSNFKSSCIKP